MMKINKIRSDIRIAETADLSRNVTNELDKVSEEVHLSALKDLIVPLKNSLVLAINRDVAESELDNYDASRDAVYRSLLYLAKGYLYHPNAQISEGARQVDAVVDRYGFELVNATYSAESALLESLLLDLKKPELVASLELLPGVTDLINKLDAEQAQFKVAEGKWLDARSDDKSEVSATSIKRELLKVLNEKLVVYLRAMMQVDPESYKELSAKIVLLIDTANGIVQRRRSNAVETPLESN